MLFLSILGFQRGFNQMAQMVPYSTIVVIVNNFFLLFKYVDLRVLFATKVSDYVVKEGFSFSPLFKYSIFEYLESPHVI